MDTRSNVLTVLLLAGTLILAGCGGSGALNKKTIDSTYTRAQSPYKAEVELQTRVHHDTSVTQLSNVTLKEVKERKTCIRQTVVLRARNKFHLDDHLSYLRLSDYDCNTPEGATWERETLRGSQDRAEWNAGGKVKNQALFWAREYLSMFYVDFPAANGVSR